MFKIVSLLLSAAAVAASGGHVSSSSLLNEDILEVVASDSSTFETLHAAVEIAGLSDTLKSDGPFTFFAPNEHAFKLLGEETLKQLFANPDELREMLLYHILPGAILAKEDIKEGAMETAQGGSIHVSLTGYNTVLNNDADIITFDVLASNGVIHVIDRFLLPSFLPSSSDPRELASLSTIADLANGNAGLTTLNTALKATGLDKTLQSAGPFTVFAPTDKAFAKLGQKTITALLKDPKALSDILLYHVVKGKVLRKDLSNDIIKAANDDNLRVQVRPNRRVIINSGSDVTSFNIMASNGVVHLIDEVLIPPKNLVDTILSDHRFSTLAVAVKAAGLVDTLKDASNEFTIFAPTNNAFKALGAQTVNALLKDPATLKSILLYHAVEGSVLRNDLKKIGSSGSVKTVQGSKLQFRFHGDSLFINDSKVIEANILASNGVIHAINKVLTIPK